MTTVAADTATTREPEARVDRRWIGLFSLAWLGIWTAQLTPVQLLLPEQVTDVLRLDPDDWVANVVAFGVVSGIAGLFALVAYPLTGALSDRTLSRFGRRRPWIAIGTVVFAAGLVMLGLQTTIVGVGALWVVTLVGFCVLTAALTAVISDQVPIAQRGTVSSWMAAPQPIGALLGVALVLALSLGLAAGYSAAAIVLVLGVAALVLRMPDVPLPASARVPLTFGAFIRGFWISPREHPDFGWTLLSRVLINWGNALTTTLLLYFFLFGLGLGQAHAETLLLVTTVVYSVFSVLAALWFGRMSDRLGRRKIFVVITAVLQAAAGAILIIAPSEPTVLVAGVLAGFGFGAFLAVDQALATEVLPHAVDRGKDLGIMNIAYAIPQALAPLAGAGLVVLGGGFWLLFVGIMVFAVAGAVALVPVKGVR